MKYILGSDRKTAQIAADLVASANAAMDRGDFAEAERIIESATRTPNQPLRAEFAAQARKCAS